MQMYERLNTETKMHKSRPPNLPAPILYIHKHPPKIRRAWNLLIMHYLLKTIPTRCAPAPPSAAPGPDINAL